MKFRPFPFGPFRSSRQANAPLLPGKRRRSPSGQIEKLEERHLMTGTPTIPNDPYLLEYQWHIVNTGQEVGDRTLQDIFGVAGEDAGVLRAWFETNASGNGYTGNGVVVAVVDNGFQLNHPDLAGNLHPTLGASINAQGVVTERSTANPNAGGVVILDATGNPYPEAARGTAIAGLIAALANNGEGGAGVAYGAKLVPINLHEDPSALPTDEAIIAALRYGILDIDIYNHTWDQRDTNRLTEAESAAVLDALIDSVLLGREGRGAVHVVSGGNGGEATLPDFFDNETTDVWDNSNYNNFTNSRYVIAVGGIDHDGSYNNVDGTFTGYPEGGANILVVAPTGSSRYSITNDQLIGSGVLTTDLIAPANQPDRDLLEGFNLPPDTATGLEFDTDRFADPAYTSRYRGTESAASVVSGVIALMLEAEPNLTYRDVQEILVRSARQNDAYGVPAQGGVSRANLDNLWVTTANEVFHLPEFPQSSLVSGDPYFDYYEIAVGDTVPMLVTDGLFSDGAGVLFHPRMTGLSGHDPDLFSNGAGYTVSGVRGIRGAETGYGHGVVDAELAVQLAEQWLQDDQRASASGDQTQSRGTQLDERTYTTFVNVVGLAIAPAIVAGEASLAPLDTRQNDDIIIPGTVGTGDNLPFYDEYYRRLVNDLNQTTGQPTGPFAQPPLPPGRTGSQYVELEVPTTETFQTEWVELKAVVGSGVGADYIENVRISLISPDGVHTELNQYFDARTTFDNTDQPQFEFAADLRGEPDTAVDPDLDSTIEWSFSSNRFWGERTDSRLAMNPATGEMYLDQIYDNATGDYTFSGGVTQRGWRLQIENFGDQTLALGSFEISWHGYERDLGDRAVTVNNQQFGLYDQAISEDQNADGRIDFGDTFRIQGFVGEDELSDHDNNPATPSIRDGIFSFDRYQQLYIDSQDGLIDQDGRFDRLGEVERFLDRSFGETQAGANDGLRPENFLENTTVELYLRITGSNGQTTETKVDQFITGDDGNYFFDVPLIRTNTDFGFEQNQAITGYEYVVRLANDLSSTNDAFDRSMDDGDALLNSLGATIGAAPTTPNGYLDHYKQEWVITEDWFVQWDRDRMDEVADTAADENPFGGQHHEFTFVDSTGTRVFNGASPFGLFDPKLHFDVNVNAQGVPVALTDLDGDGMDDISRVQTGIRGINFLVRSAERTVSFTGNVYSDRNADGDRDIPQDAPLSGVTVYIDANGNGVFDPAGTANPDPSTQTAANGSYTFTNVAIGSSSLNLVTIGVVLPAGGFTFTSPASGTATFAVDPGESFTQDFLLGLPPTQTPGSIPGTVFFDLDGDGARDDGEFGQPNITVFVDSDGDSNLDAGEISTVTDTAGAFTLTGVPSTAQTVRVVLPNGFVQTLPGGNAGVNVNVPRDGVSAPILFGVREPLALGSVGGSVFRDTNADGDRDAGEPAEAGVLVYLDLNRNGQREVASEPAVTTGADGSFNFPFVGIGTIDVRIIPNAPLLQTLPEDGAPRTIELLGGENETGLLFGVADGTIFGRDFGDLGLGYATLENVGGPWHNTRAGVYLGARFDNESNGQPSSGADGDDNNSTSGVPDDEDGVVLNSGALTPGANASFTITVKGAGQLLNGWIDFDGDRVFEANERVFANIDLQDGSHQFNVAVPAGPALSNVGARFRWGPRDIGPTGGAIIGEVEDYLYNAQTINQVARQMGDYDNNGTVQQADYTLWKSLFGSADLRADGNGDGSIDAADYTVWRDHLGMSVPGGALGESGLAAPATVGGDPLSRSSISYDPLLGWTRVVTYVQADPLTGFALPSVAVESLAVTDLSAGLAESPADAAAGANDLDLYLALLATEEEGSDTGAFDLLETSSESEAPEASFDLAIEDLLTV